MTIREALKVYDKAIELTTALETEAKELDGFRARGDWAYIAEHAANAAKVAKKLDEIAREYFSDWDDYQSAMQSWLDRGETAFCIELVELAAEKEAREND